MSEDGLIQPMTIDQAAGAFALAMGALGSLLLVIWQSRCECDLNLCYLFRCHRKPAPEPPPEEKKEKKEKDKKDKKDKTPEKPEPEIERVNLDEDNP